MRIVALVVVVFVALAVMWFVLIPANTFFIFRRPGSGTVSISRGSIEFLPPPDHYTTGAFDRIEAYVTRLMAPSQRMRFLSLFTASGDRGFALHAKDGVVEAHLTVEWRQEPKREAALRSFFESRGILATEDYLAGNGDVPDATRLLAYPLPGDASEVASVTKRILQELCGVSPAEPMDIGYSEE